MSAIGDWWQRVKISFDPRRYDEISGESLRRMIWHVPLVVMAGFCIWLLLLTPSLFSFVDGVESQLQSFSELKLDATVTMATPIEIPANDPKFVIDLVEQKVIGDEAVKLTKKYIYFNIFGKPQQIPVDKMLRPLDYKTEFGNAVFLGVLFILPSIFFYAYLSFLVKYAFIIGLTTLVGLFVVHVLLILDISPKRVINIAVYSATPMVLVETLVTPIDSSYLLPLYSILGMNLYAVTLGLYLGLFITGLVMQKEHDKHEDGRWNF